MTFATFCDIIFLGQILVPGKEKIMQKSNLFDNIEETSVLEMIPCFKPEFRKYGKGETIMSYEGEVPDQICVLYDGEARLEILNEKGDTFLMEKYGKNDVFGGLFTLPLENFEYIVTAVGDATVMYLDYKHVITPCEELCAHHNQLISNLFMMTAQKSQELSLHISILSQSTIKNKIMTYLKYISSKEEPGQEFRIPMSLAELADYLRVDRSAMMREIKVLKDDGIIMGKGRVFKLV